jgi:hypothetical protein
MNRKLATAGRDLATLVAAPEPLWTLGAGAATWLLTARAGLDLLGASGLWREDEQDPTRALALGLGLALASFVVLLVGAAFVLRRPDHAGAVLVAFGAFALPAVGAWLAGSLAAGAPLGLQFGLAASLATALGLLLRRGLARRRSRSSMARPAARRWRLARTTLARTTLARTTSSG